MFSFYFFLLPKIFEFVGKKKAIIVEGRESGNKEIPWFSHENLHPHTKALDGYIFII